LHPLLCRRLNQYQFSNTRVTAKPKQTAESVCS
jgi:hypothetical protein